MSKKSELKNLKKRIKYANSHLNTSLGIESMNNFSPSEPVTVKNVKKISRELKKWQAEKRLKQKKENFSIRAFKFNEIVPNVAFQFNAYPQNEKQLKQYDKYLRKLKKNVIIKKDGSKPILNKNFFKARDEIINRYAKKTPNFSYKFQTSHPCFQCILKLLNAL